MQRFVLVVCFLMLGMFSASAQATCPTNCHCAELHGYPQSGDSGKTKVSYYGNIRNWDGGFSDSLSHTWTTGACSTSQTCFCATSQVWYFLIKHAVTGDKYIMVWQTSDECDNGSPHPASKTYCQTQIYDEYFLTYYGHANGNPVDTDNWRCLVDWAEQDFRRWYKVWPDDADADLPFHAENDRVIFEHLSEKY